mmetsp:Transcript_37159/g.89637  ORF Transcript_37159/g.89637 Transcript_37159/m.89637 type:complete len:99 (+) Transcript_37159:82-378(+)
MIAPPVPLFFRGKSNVGGKGQNRSTCGSGSRMPLYQGKKAESSFLEGGLTEAAFHLLKWAGRGEELPFRMDARERNDGATAVDGMDVLKGWLRLHERR